MKRNIQLISGLILGVLAYYYFTYPEWSLSFVSLISASMSALYGVKEFLSKRRSPRVMDRLVGFGTVAISILGFGYSVTSIALHANPSKGVIIVLANICLLKLLDAYAQSYRETKNETTVLFYWILLCGTIFLELLGVMGQMLVFNLIGVLIGCIALLLLNDWLRQFRYQA
ncbi:hypothetical protein [Streptococcus moroccensis]|uniref:Multisubunit Na+/H+ antiporter MnhG subunit n=1 Tax=Streptococcus moroccensis TaxID=1451356 RepID=A0ABT9YRA4_9STRE|nr:hypothetical protein [Streptococcus moroccensis]MDQ0222259.1 multisubunit Na+/H+ antiporter MnhG subunit [Streptococcus moroccensis]